MTKVWRYTATDCVTAIGILRDVSSNLQEGLSLEFYVFEPALSNCI